MNSHSAAVTRLRKLGLESAYHVCFKRPHGTERNPTHWHRKNTKTAYHIDYVFLGQRLLLKLEKVIVGRSHNWLSVSDHAPVLVELDL